MLIKEIQVTPSGVVVIDYIKENGQSDTLYIAEKRLIRSLESVAKPNGLVQQASKPVTKTIKITIQ